MGHDRFWEDQDDGFLEDDFEFLPAAMPTLAGQRNTVQAIASPMFDVFSDVQLWNYSIHLRMGRKLLANDADPHVEPAQDLLDRFIGVAAAMSMLGELQRRLEVRELEAEDGY